MSTARPPEPKAGDGSDLSFSGMCRSEWYKLLSLRSVIVAIGLMPIISLIGSMLILVAALIEPSGNSEPQSPLLQTILASVIPLSAIAAAVGVLGAGSEYREAAILSVLTAVPRRRPLAAAKATTSFMLAATMTVLSTALALAITGIFHPASVALHDLVVATLSVALAGLGVGGFAVIGTATASIHRSVASAIMTLVCLFVVLPVATATLLAPSISNVVAPFLPTTAAQSLSLADPQLNPLFGLAVLAAWVTIAITAMLRSMYRENRGGRSSRVRSLARRNAGVSSSPRRLTFWGQLQAAIYRFGTLRITRWSTIITLALAIAASVFQALSVASNGSLSSGFNGEQLSLQVALGVTTAATANLIVLFVPLVAATLVLQELTHAPAAAVLSVAPRRLSTFFSALSGLAIMVFFATLIGLLLATSIAAPIVSDVYPPKPGAATAIFLAGLQAALSITVAVVFTCAIAIVSRSIITTAGISIAFFAVIPAVTNSAHANLVEAGNVWLINVLTLLPNGSTGASLPDLEWTWVTSGGELMLPPYATIAVNLIWAVIAVVLASVYFARRPAGR